MAMSEPVSVLDLSPSLAASNAVKRRTLAVLLMVIIASVFWVDSRYPALMKRYRAGTQIKASGALTFGSPYAVDRAMPLAQRTWRTTLNWLDANRVGMTFSFLFGPAALTFLATLGRRRSQSRWLNTAYGAVAGVPLAVCSNCIAPIARGLLASGMSTESVLATMFASPALNVVVLAMTFALFPAPVALLRGVPLPYVVTLLCTLGIVSVYSLSIVGKSISWRVAGAAYATVALLGTLAGVATRMVG
jgi:hypothetical protein